MAGESQLGVAQVPIRATLDELDKDLGDAKRKCEGAMAGVADRIKSGFLDLGKVVALGLGAATGAVVGAGAALGKLAVDALPLQGVRDAFAGITGDADTMLAKLREGSLGMVKDADLMKSYNSAAQLVSKTFADQLPDAMGYLSKVSAATGQDMGFMIDSLVKGVGRVSPMILDNLGIQVAMSDATARAAKMFGVEEKELSKAQIQAGMMNVVLEKLAANTAKMPEVAGTAQQKWAALGVTMQNLKDRVGMAFIPVLMKVLEPLGLLAERYGPRVEAFFDNLSRAIGGAIDALTKGYGPFTAIGEILDNFLPESVMSRVWEFLGWLDEMSAKVGGFVTGSLLPFVTGLTGGGDWGAKFAGLDTTVTTLLTNLATRLLSWVTESLPGWLASLSQFAMGAGQWILDALPVVLNNLASLGQSLLSTVMSYLPGWIESLAQFALELVQWIVGKLPDLARNLGQFFNKMVNWIADNLPTWVMELSKLGLKLVMWVIDALPGLATNLGKVAGALLKWLGQTLVDVAPKLLDLAKQMVSWVATDVLPKLPGALLTILEAILRFVAGILTEISPELGKVAGGIIDGLVKGIQDAAGRLVEAAKGVVSSALQAAKNLLGIHSPSLVAAKMIGEPFVLGIGRGIEQAMGSLDRVLRLELRDLTIDARGLVDRGEGGSQSTTIQNYWTINPSYRESESEGDLYHTIRALQMAGA